MKTSNGTIKNSAKRLLKLDMVYFAIVKKIPQLVESKGLWEQEVLIAFHFKIPSLFNQINWENYISDFQKKKQFILES